MTTCAATATDSAVGKAVDTAVDACCAVAALGANCLLLRWRLQHLQQVTHQVQRPCHQHLHAQCWCLADTPPQPVECDAQAGQHGTAGAGSLSRRQRHRRRLRQAGRRCDGWERREGEGRRRCCPRSGCAAVAADAVTAADTAAAAAAASGAFPYRAQGVLPAQVGGLASSPQLHVRGVRRHKKSMVDAYVSLPQRMRQRLQQVLRVSLLHGTRVGLGEAGSLCGGATWCRARPRQGRGVGRRPGPASMLGTCR